jgi:hypothetical protein
VANDWVVLSSISGVHDNDDDDDHGGGDCTDSIREYFVGEKLETLTDA